MYACNDILFNHESPRRGETFVTRKITRAVAHIALGKQEKLYLGNMNAERDWGHAKDYVEAMWRMLQQDQPEDFVIATGKSTSVRDFVKMAFAEVGISLVFEGEGKQETGIIESIDFLKLPNKDAFLLKKGDVVIEIDPRYYRPTEVEQLIGEASKAERILGWKPTYTLAELASEMVREDLKKVRTN